MRHAALCALASAAIALGCGAKVRVGDLGATAGAGGAAGMDGGVGGANAGTGGSAGTGGTGGAAGDASAIDAPDAFDGRSDAGDSGPDQDASATPQCVVRSERYEPGHEFAYVGGNGPQLPPCAPTCGSAFHRDNWNSTDALPAGACETTSAACDMPAWQLCSCGTGGSLDGYRCSCVDGRWSCVIVGARGLGVCSCGGTDAGADADADVRDAPATCPTINGHPKADCTYPVYPGFTLNLVEEFDEPIDLVNDPNWTYSDGFGDNRYTRYKKEALSFADGKLILTITAPGVPNAGYPTYAEGELNNYPAVVTGTTTCLGGEFRSKYNNWHYGRFEARMKAPSINADGNFINAFFTFRTPKWLRWEEHTFEVTHANASTYVGTNIVWGNNAPAYGNTSNSYISKPVPSLADSGTIFDDFHTYAFEILPTKLNWYADGDLIRTETGAAVRLPEMSMKIMINHWVFPSSGWGGGNPANNVYPMHSEVDWIRLYKYDAGDMYPCSPTPNCLPVEDRAYAKNNAEDGVPAAAPW
jgi:endo-1,3-1,4-beta-glycanase ExoK